MMLTCNEYCHKQISRKSDLPSKTNLIIREGSLTYFSTLLNFVGVDLECNCHKLCSKLPVMCTNKEYSHQILGLRDEQTQPPDCTREVRSKV